MNLRDRDKKVQSNDLFPSVTPVPRVEVAVSAVPSRRTLRTALHEIPRCKRQFIT